MPESPFAAGLPERMEIERGSGTAEPTRAFAGQYRALVEEVLRVFPAAEHPEAADIPADARAFVAERYRGAPDMRRELSREIFTALRDLDARKRRVNGHTLHDHQFAHLAWAAMSVCDGKDSPGSLLLRGAPGTGKTLTQGLIMQAGIRLQVRGIMEGSIAYLTAKPFHLTQQVRGKAASRRRILRAPPFRLTDPEVRKLHREMAGLVAKDVQKLFPSAVWLALFATPAGSVMEAKAALKHSLEERGLWDGFKGRADADDVLGTLAAVLAGEMTTVRGPDGDPELLPLPPLEEDAAADVLSYTGDAAVGIPKDYPVLARETWSTGVVEEADPRVILMPVTAFTSTVQRQRMEKVLKGTELVLIDEARRMGPMAFQGPVVDAGGASPLVIAATAVDYGKEWGRRSPEQTLYRSVEDRILPDIGLDVFPSAKEAHYASETKEALDQLVAAHFEVLKLPRELGLRQPHEDNTLLIVNGKLTADVAKRLRAEYEKRKQKAQVFCYDGKASVADKERLQLWFNGGGEGAKVLVSTPALAADALDLPAIGGVTIGTRVTSDVLYRLMGRLTHSARRDERGYLRIQQFSTSSLTAQPFHDLRHGLDLDQKDGFKWVPAQVLLSRKEALADAKRVDGREKALGARDVPPLGVKKDQAVRVVSGTPLFVAGKHAAPDTAKPAPLPTANGAAEKPTEGMVEAWLSTDFGTNGTAWYRRFPGPLFMAAMDAHRASRDPRQAVRDKLTQLQTKYAGGSNGANGDH